MNTEKKLRVFLFADLLSSINKLKMLLKKAFSQNLYIDIETKYEKVYQYLSDNKVDIILISFKSLDDIVQILKKFVSDFPQIPIVVLGDSNTENYGKHIIRDGAEDFLDIFNISAKDLKKSIEFGIQRKINRNSLMSNYSVLNTQEQILYKANRMPLTGLWSWNLSNGKIILSDQASKIFGLKNESNSILVSQFWKLIHNEDIEKVQSVLYKLNKKTNQLEFYFRIIKNDNSQRVIFSLFSFSNQANNSSDHIIQVISQDVTERILHEKKYSLLFEAAPDGILTLNSKGFILSWNKKATELFYNSDQKLLDLTFYDVFDFPKDSLNKMLTDAFSNKGLPNQPIEILAKRNDCTTFPAEISLAPILVGGIEIGICFIRDITQRKQVERECKEKEQLYRTCLESLSEGMVIKDVENNILFANTMLENMTGYNKTEIYGRNFSEIFYTMKNGNTKGINFETDKLPVSFEIPIKKKCGELFWAKINTAPFKNDSGIVVGTVSAISDISISKREKELEELVFATTQSYNSLLISDRNGKIEWINEGFSRLFGYKRDEVIDRNVSFLSPLVNHIPKSKDPYFKVVKDKKPVIFEAIKFANTGEKFWVLSTLTPVINHEGEVVRIIAIDSDISRRKSIEQQLRSTKRIAVHSLNRLKRAYSDLEITKLKVENTIKAKEMFLANMSHEIRTPMNGIIGLTEVLLKNTCNKQQEEYLNAIKTSGETLMVVINDILDVSKMDAGKMTFEQVPFHLRELTDSVYELFNTRAKNKNLEFNRFIDEKIPQVLLGDPARLNQIIMNLVGNAVKFTNRGSVNLKIVLKNDLPESVDIELIVKDTGRGIPEDKLESIFLDFTQVNPETARKYGGTGLGLAITKRLVELQQGKITVKSKLKEGSEFVVMLNYKKAKEEDFQSKEIILNKNPDDLKGVKILLAEDNPINQMLAVKVLSDWGCQIDVVENGKQVIRKLKENPNYDLILMDVKMPEMDGYQATAFIRKTFSDQLKNIPIIAQTAHAATWETQKCLDSGMNDYVSKPFDLDLLYDKILKNINPKK